jgi:hypothetical protein
MTTEPNPVPGKHPWLASIDARLVARLVRPLRPGLIGSGLAHRIVGGVEAMARRLGLLERFPRVAERAGVAGPPAIVHVLWPRPPEERAECAERGERAGGGVREATLHQAAMQVVSSRVVERERRIERTIVERITAVAAAPAAPAPAPPVGSAGRAASMAQLAPEARRSRMGAPLSKRETTQVASPPARHAHALANHARPAVEPPAAASALVALARPSPNGRAHRRPERLLTEPIDVIEAPLPSIEALPPVAPRRPRAAVHEVPNAITAPPDIVAPNRSGRRSTPRRASVLPDHVARANEPSASREPVVPPRRSRPGAHAAAALPLAHVAAPPVAAPIAIPHAAPVAPSALAAPAAPPIPRAVVAGPSPGTPPPPPRLDLQDIAARVQLILQRQMSHERARRGLPR